MDNCCTARRARTVLAVAFLSAVFVVLGGLLLSAGRKINMQPQRVDHENDAFPFSKAAAASSAVVRAPLDVRAAQGGAAGKIKPSRMLALPGVLHAKLPGRFPFKYWLIDFNGWLCRVIGKRMCNARLLYDDGYLGYAYTNDDRPVEPFVRSTVAFANRLKELAVPFLYVQAPCKLALEGGGQLPAEWAYANPNEAALRVEVELEAHGVRTLDLVREFATTRKEVEAHFYRTDHHWQVSAAFKAAGLISRELAAILGDSVLRDPPQLDREGWERQLARRAFLGSHGRRTGRFFAGVDDFECFVPKFETDIQYFVSTRLVARGSFEKSVLNLSCLTRTLHDRNAYGVYGADKKEEWYINVRAPSRARILIVKDSFANPAAAFLSVVCREVVKVDPRKCASGEELLEIVRRHRPDVVMMLVNPGAVRNSKFIWKE